MTNRRVAEARGLLRCPLDAEVATIAAQFADIIADETHHRDEVRQILSRRP